MITLQNGRTIDKPVEINGKKIMNPYDFFSGADKIFNLKNGNFLKQLEPELMDLLEYLTHTDDSNFLNHTDDSNFLYYPPLRQTVASGSFIASILIPAFFQIIISEAKDNNKLLLEIEFCKFLTPCDHPDYDTIGSWCEDLNFTKSECITALKKIVFKTNRKTPPEIIPTNKLFLSRQNMENITFYRLNPKYSGVLNG